MEDNSTMKIEYPDTEERERQITQIVTHAVLKPQKLTSALWSVWEAAGVRGICFGVWDCMLLALLLDGVVWAAVYEAARQSPQLLGLLVFLVSPVLYAMLHLLTVWKEIMAGMYQTLMVCRLSLRQITVLRLLLFGGVSVLLLGGINLWAGMYGNQELSAIRMLSLSMSALFFYAWMQLLLEWKWRHRLSCGAAPFLWGICSILLLTADGYGLQILEAVPTAALLVCAGVCAGMYFGLLKKCYYTVCEECL